jgi:hypothetical protein
MGYLARVVEPECSFDSLKRFDDIIDAAVYKLAGSDVVLEKDLGRRNITNLLRSLPLGLGGLGITRYADISGEKAILMSRRVTFAFISKFYDSFAESAKAKWSLLNLGSNDPFSFLDHNSNAVLPGTPALILEEGESHEEITSSAAVRVRREYEVESEDESLNAKKICRDIQTRRHLQLIAHLKSTDRNAAAVMLRGSRFKGSGHWLIGQGGQLYGKYGFHSDDEYKAALRLRLLLSPALSGVDARGSVLCSCCSKPIDTFHELDCVGCNQYHYKHRHDMVRDTLSTFLKEQSNQGATAFSIFTEPAVKNILNTPDGEELLTVEDIEDNLPRRDLANSLRNLHQFRADRQHQDTIRADVGRFSAVDHVLQYIDVAVVNSSAATYLALENGRNIVGSRTAVGVLQKAVVAALRNQGSGGTAHREVDKKEKYRGLIGDRVDVAEHFVPFVVEATGRLGPAARQFIGMVLKESKVKFAQQSLFIKIGAIIARYNAMMALAWAKRISSREIVM